MSTLSDPPRTSLLRDRDVKRYLAGQLSAEVGSRISREGLPIVAIVSVGAGAPALALLAALATLPSLLAGNVVGQAVDRTRRRPLLIGANVARALILFAIPVLYLTHHLTMAGIAAVTVLAALAALVVRVARHAYLPTLVGRHRLEEGNEWVGTAESIGETAGPGLMGLLIQAVGAPLAMAFDALSNLIAAASLVSLSRPEPNVASAPPSGAGTGIQIGHVWSRVLRHPILGPLFLNAGVGALAGGFFSTLYELYVLKTLHLSPFLLGLLITSGGLGSLIGTRLFRRLRRRLNLGRLMAAAYFIFALLNLAVPAAHGTLWVKFLLLFIAQFGGDLWATIFEIGAATVEQHVTPDHWLGRVHGTFRALSGGVEVVGALAAAPLALWLGVRGAFWLAALGLMASGLLLMVGRMLRYEPAEEPFWPAFDQPANG
ncbi:MFS transporter [Sulfobacillus harzensis]|uniref:MFS transporter n=1 Tax=Sulfobacillus harzensis TaxID=2729629 RepID=A0A7Y0Q2L3_9FIRM|nr:MFS transporter [Sulfobacillus harzensis]NMP22460.1 MFS transporter [Sulfobacillus harzensis]